MITVAIGAIRPRTPLHALIFWAYAVPSFMQAQRAQGVLHAQVAARWGFQFSFTLWPDQQSMYRFSRSGAHRRAMRVAHWLARDYHFKIYQAETAPDFETALRAWACDAKAADLLAARGIRDFLPRSGTVSQGN